jgi:type VI secretion system protein ImpM
MPCTELSVAEGLFGKLPARGDFVRAGLPTSFVAPFDAWWQAVLPASRACLGPAWLPAWLEAPVWRFLLPAEMCGPHAALGLWLPSVDRAGRHFPLAFARLGPWPALIAAGAAFLAAAERAGRAALAEDLPPSSVLARLDDPAPGGPPLPDPPAPGQALWWTEGGPRIPAARLAMPGLPDVACFAAMLDATG